MISTIDERIQTVLGYYQERGHEEYHGELVNQLEHAVQSADLAKALRPDDPEFILAAFLHDLGHLCGSTEDNMEGFGIRQHEIIGANALRDLNFSDKVTRLIEGHVQAKRYLVSTDQNYFNKLSEASKITLEKQGGPLSLEEQKMFEADELFELHIALRRIDEQAKVQHLPIGDLKWLEDILREHLTQTIDFE